MSTIRTMKTSLALSIATCMLVAAAPAHAQTTPVIAVQTVNTEMQTMFPPSNNPFDFLGGNVMPGTSPAITAFQTIYGIAFQDVGGTLWVGWPDGGLDFNLSNSGLRMKPGTSPSMARFALGFKVAFQSDAGELWIYTLGAPAFNTHLGMMAGTSPSITTLSTGDCEIAFQANTGVLWTVSPAGVGAPTSATMMPRTSPRITGLSTGGFEIAYQSSTGKLSLMNTSGVALNTTLSVMAGTSPSITALAAGKWEVAFQANTGVLWTVLPTTTGGAVGTNTGLAMMPGTNPAIAALGTGVEIAFQATTGLLSYVPPGGTVTTMTETVQTGTSPSIAVF
jgi:hypothetical protein